MPADMISQGDVASAGFQLRMHNINVIMGDIRQTQNEECSIFFFLKQGSVIKKKKSSYINGLGLRRLKRQSN